MDTRGAQDRAASGIVKLSDIARRHGVPEDLALDLDRIAVDLSVLYCRSGLTIVRVGGVVYVAGKEVWRPV